MGYLQNILDRLEYPYEEINLIEGEKVNFNTDDISGLIFMGGAGNVNAPEDWMMDEIELIKQADEKSIPMLGICLGAQLISKALGGCVCESDQLEVGWHEVFLKPEVKKHPWFEGVPDQFTAFHWHAHICTPPPGGIPAISNNCTESQGFIYKDHLAIQFHLEMTAEKIHKLTDLFACDIANPTPCVNSKQQLLDNLNAHCEHIFSIADNLLSQWIKSVYVKC